MAVDLLYFAWVRESIGRDGETVEPPSHVASVSDLLDWLAASSEPHANAFADRARLRAAVDQRFVPLDTAILGAREIAIFPPVTGG
ncbi:MAG: molybdopterin converting factor subunit 1 [Sphingomonadaceae bacterium]